MAAGVTEKAAKKNVKNVKAAKTPKKIKKEPKPPKKKVDRSDPNWKLKPNEKVTILQKVSISENLIVRNISLGYVVKFTITSITNKFICVLILTYSRIQCLKRSKERIILNYKKFPTFLRWLKVEC